MAELVLIVLCIAAVFVLAMHRAPLWAWAAVLGAATFVWRSRHVHGDWQEPRRDRLGCLHGSPLSSLLAFPCRPSGVRR